MSRVMLSIPNQFLKKVDRQAKLEMRTRSEFVREALRFYLVQSPWQKRVPPMWNPRVRQATKDMDALAKKGKTDWDSTAAIRAMRGKLE